MKKMYVTPEMEIVETELACFLAASDPHTDDGWGHMGAPEMMSFDDMDEDYMDEDNI